MLLIILGVVIVLASGVLIARSYNDRKYGNDSLTDYAYYENVTDLSLYPKEAEGLKIEYVDAGALQGFHITPDVKKYPGVVVCYGGSEGSPNFEQAERLAGEGYETLAVFMFGMKNQPKTLARIPLEQFEDVLNYLDETIAVKGPVTVLGASKGAEYALNLAVKYERIANLVLIAPSAYTFAGLDFDHYGSSWTRENQAMPFIDIKKSSFPAFVGHILIPMLVKSPVQYRETYDSAARQDPEREKKRIPAEQIKANILLIAGEADQMWGSVEMAGLIKDRSKNAVLRVYEDAGHIFAGNGVLNVPGLRIRIGGSREANEKADRESFKAITAFLAERHGG